MKHLNEARDHFYFRLRSQPIQRDSRAKDHKASHDLNVIMDSILNLNNQIQPLIATKKITCNFTKQGTEKLVHASNFGKVNYFTFRLTKIVL